MAKVNASDLKSAIKALNDTGELEDKIKVVGQTTKEMAAIFMETVGMLAEAEREVPDSVVEFYNSLPDDPNEIEEEAKPEPEKKKAVAKKKAAPKAKAKKKDAPKAKAKPKAALKPKATPKAKEKDTPAAKKSTVKKDDFGYKVGSKAALFVKAISIKAGRTMKEVREMDWNDKNASFYDIFNRLVEKDLAQKDEKSGKMTLK